MIKPQPSAPKQTAAFVKLNQITQADDFKFRSGRTDHAHVKTILNGMNIKGELKPILLWRENHGGAPSGRLILLDGMHRLEAHTVQLRGKPQDDPTRKRGIPAMIVDCNYDEAIEMALKANTNDSLPLTPSERTNGAWRLVRLFQNGWSKAKISKTATVGIATITRMRARLAEFTARGAMPSGIWHLDRDDGGQNKEAPQQTPEELQAEIDLIAPAVRKAFGLKPKRDAVRDAEVLRRVFGTFYFKRVISEFLATKDETTSEADTIPDDIKTGIKTTSSSIPAEDEFAL